MKTRLLLAPLLLAAAPQTPPPAASIDGLPIGAIPKQQLPKRGCAAYLWAATSGGTRVLVAMAQADPATLRLSVGGMLIDLERTAQTGTAGFGFSTTSEYGGGSTTAALTMRIETQAALTQGAVVPEATLRLDRPGQDTVVLPVSGLIGCV